MLNKIKFFIVLCALLTTHAFAITKVLKPYEAFDISIKTKKTMHEVHVKLGQDIYLYKDKLKVLLPSHDKKDITSQLEFPEATSYAKHEVFAEDFVIEIPFSLLEEEVNKEPYKLQIKWQGCSKKGLCYQPMKIKESFSALHVKASQKDEPTKTTQAQAQPKEISQQDAIAKTLAESNIFWIIVTFFGFGLLLSLTPCVFPMIPILSSIIVAQGGEKMDTKRGFFLSLVYVLAMSAAYTMAGVLAGLFGANVSTAMQNPYVLTSFSLIFVALAFSMFGFYELQMPQFIQNKLNKTSDNAKNQGIAGIAIMGFLSALIVGPCVAAPLAGALIYIGQTGDAFLGGMALFFMSLGMGVPLLLIGASAGKLLPKPGFWMDTIKTIFGVLMLGVAIWMIERVISPSFSLFLWSALFVGSAIYAGALEPLKEGVNGWKKLLKTFSFLLLLYGVVLFIGAFSGGKSLFEPLAKTPVSVVEKKTTKPLHVKNIQELENIIQTSKKPVIIDFWATWCAACMELEHETFSNADVQKELENFTFVKIDVSKNTQDDKALLQKFNLFGPPGIIFYKDKQELKNKQLVGFVTPKNFIEHLKKVNNN